MRRVDPSERLATARTPACSGAEVQRTLATGRGVLAGVVLEQLARAQPQPALTASEQLGGPSSPLAT